ncbi:MAG TPA: hypothetical protein VEE86_02735 [Thermoplasmata archaeon]|nr:hypothetical protein [Thermoplasmata archaeon]
MGQRRRARSRSGFRRSRGIRGDRRGVVAVVGTLLALLVFFALFGIFLTQYVPLWMDENESQFSNQMQASLATFKSGVDDQYILGGIPSYTVPFTMNSASVPLLTQPTIATFSYLNGCPSGFNATTAMPVKPASCDFARLVYSTAAGAAGSQTHNYNETAPTNYLQAAIPNRYYVPVTYYFESDAIAGEQGSGRAWIVAPPPVNVSLTSGNLTVRSSLVVFLGNGSSFSSQGTKDLTDHELSQSNVSSTGRFLSTSGARRTFNVTMILGVHDVCAWYNFLYNETEHAFGSNSSTYWTLAVTQGSTTLTLPLALSVCLQSLSSTYDLTLKVFNVNYAQAFLAQDQITFNAGGL